MYSKIASYDEKGNPTRIYIDDGYMQTSRPFDEKTDGWILNQLDINDFQVIEIGKQMEMLVNEVNYLRRENFRLKK